jgi:hypothetical protein
MQGTVVVAPSGLTATIASPTSVTLTWIDNSTNENAFQVWRQVNNAGAFALVGTVLRTTAQRNATGGTVTFTNTGLTANTYSYYVVALKTTNPTGTSAPTPTVAITLAVPAAPTGLLASVFTLNAKSSIVGLTWVDNANNETGYLVQRCSATSAAGCGAGGPWTNINPLQPADETAYSETRKRLASPSFWSYRVRATNVIGNSAFSNIVTVTIAQQ